jgi:RNA polymerase sigma-70 factor, ECF subfamily
MGVLVGIAPEPAQRELVVISIRLGEDTAESRGPEEGDSDDFPVSEGVRNERTGRDFFEDGRKERFEVLALQHLDAAYNLARWLVRNDDDANDIVQDAYLRAMRAFDGFRGDNARPWLLAIVRNTAFTWLRKNRPPEVHVPYEEDIHGDARAESGPEPETPERHALRTENRRAVNDALARLPVELREAIVLRELEDLSYREIASVQAVPIGTVMSRLSRGRQLLGRYLRREMMGGSDALQ